MAKQWTAQELFKISGAYWAGCALQTAVQLDLFSLLEDGPRTEKDLAASLNCNPRAFGMLVTALAAMQLVVRLDNDTVAAEKSVLPFLSSSSDDYVGFIINHHAHLMPSWTRLAATVKSGTPPDDSPITHTQDEKKREAFLMGMFNIARLQAESIAGALDLTQHRRLLDVGGGPGTYALYFCRANPHLAATIFDLPTTEPFARKTIDRFGMADRVDFVGGNFLSGPLPDGHDIAWLSQVLHGQTPEEAAALVKRSAAAIEPGGMVCVQEFMLNDDLRGPEHAALFSLNMLVRTQGGQAYTEKDITAMLKEAGAESIHSLDIALPQSCRILIGRMP